jgi:thiol-disulfide isomerase/thioredoxin
MKKFYLYIYGFLLITFQTFSQNNHPSFQNLPSKIEDLFLNKENKKPVFLEVFLPTCGHCLAYNETFKNPILKNFLDQNYEAYQLDLSKNENQEFLKKRKLFVYSTPTFLVFGPDGKLWNFDAAEEEFNSVDGILNLLNKAKSTEKRQLTLLENYKKGKFNKNDLIEIGNFTRYTLDTTLNIKIINDLTKILPKTEYESELGFKIIQKMMIDEENPLFDHFIKNLKKYHLYADSATISQAGENVIMNSLYNPNAKNYSFERYDKMKKELITLGVSSRAVATRFIYYEVIKFLQQENQTAAIKKIKNYYQNKSIPIKEKDFWCNTLKKYNSKLKDCPL